MRKFLFAFPSKIPRSTEELLRRYERYISPLSLLVGFTIDSIALRRVDFFWGNVLLFSYLAVASVSIVLFHLIHSGRLRGKFFLFLLPFTTIAIQFGFGGLFSGFVVLYSHSAAVATSWVFVVALAALMIGNERFRRYYTQFVFQASILFVALFTFLIFFTPLLVGSIGTTVFLISEGIAVGLTVLFLRGFAWLMPEIFRDVRWTVRKTLTSILLLFNVLYFTNAIPPLPLALKEAGVYHDVRKVGNGYAVRAEPRTWYQQYLNYNTTFHAAPGERAYVFTAIFAPTRFTMTVSHDWEYYDGSAWVLKNSVSFAIIGGRDGGYRGYTYMDKPDPGAWRVNVRSGGKLIGRVAFSVVPVPVPAATVSEER